MTTRVKLRCYFVNKDYESSEWVELGAFYDQSSEENKAFWEATPAAQVRFHINNPNAKGFFKPGKDYYFDISEA